MQYGKTHYVIGSTDPGKITIRDVANSLSRINRFTGHGTTYSVAKHSVFVSELLDMDTETALYGLAHDVHETVVSDLNWPLKQALGSAAREELKRIEELADVALYKVFGLQWPMPAKIAELVKKADWIAVATEKRDLLPGCDRQWDMLPYAPHHRHVSPTVTPKQDMEAFLGRAVELGVDTWRMKSKVSKVSKAPKRPEAGDDEFYF